MGLRSPLRPYGAGVFVQGRGQEVLKLVGVEGHFSMSPVLSASSQRATCTGPIGLHDGSGLCIKARGNKEQRSLGIGRAEGNVASLTAIHLKCSGRSPKQKEDSGGRVEPKPGYLLDDYGGPGSS